MSKLTKTKGYTAVEIIIISAIILILAGITITAVIGYTGDAVDMSRAKETQSVADAAGTAVYKVYQLGIPIDEINSSDKAAVNLRKKILSETGATGHIISFHVSNGQNCIFSAEATGGKPAPMHLDFTKVGTLEFLEYESADGRWVGQYRAMPDYSAEIRVLDAPQGGSKVMVNDDQYR